MKSNYLAGDEEDSENENLDGLLLSCCIFFY